MNAVRSVLTLVVFAFATGAAGIALAQDVRWYGEYSAAMEEARRTNKPLLVSFRCVP